MKIKKLIGIAITSALLASCGDQPKETSKVVKKEPKKFHRVTTPDFNADSAYQYVAEQVALGPRVPNTVAHQQAAAYLEEKLVSFGASVTVQEGVVTAFDGTKLN